MRQKHYQLWEHIYWIYKRFGLITFSIIAAILLISPYLLLMNNQFYNPHPTFMLSFLYLPLLAEYITQKKPFIPALLLFPILALMWHSHFATFFSAIITLIVYLIIRWNKTTKYNIKPLLIGIFISFLTYLPYLMSEIQSGFLNTSYMLDAKDGANIVFQPPQLYSILFFPTTEINSNYGNSIIAIFSRWFFNEHVLKFSFIFYILSIVLAFSALFIAFKHFFKKCLYTNNEENTNMIRELLFFYLLYIVVTMVAYMFFNLGSARGRYFYNVYTLTYIPLIYLIEYLKSKNTKVLRFIIIYCFFNVIALFAYMRIFYIQEGYSDWRAMRQPLEAIIEDSNNEYFSFEGDNLAEQVVKGYIGIDKWKMDPYSNLKYIMVVSEHNEKRFESMMLMSSNQYYKAFKIR